MAALQALYLVTARITMNNTIKNLILVIFLIIAVSVGFQDDNKAKHTPVKRTR